MDIESCFGGRFLIFLRGYQTTLEDLRMKRVAKPVFFIVALLIIALSCMAFFGVHGRNGDIPVTYIKGLNDIRWGIDIKGGVEATFSPADGVQATREDMESAKAII